MKKIFIFLLFLVVLSSYTFAGNYQTFTESFGDTSYYILNECTVVNSTGTGAGNDFNNLSNYNVGYLIPNFDNDFYCIVDESTGNNLIKNTTSNNHNTFSGVSVGRGGASCLFGNCETGFATVFNDYISFSDDDTIEFYCMNFPDETGSDPVVSFIFGEDDINRFALALNDNSAGSECGLSNTPDNCCSLINLYDNVCVNTTEIQFINLSWQNISNICSVQAGAGFDSSNLSHINYFGIELIGNGLSKNFIIDDVYFSYFNGTNNLPIGNLSLTPALSCINDGETAVFNITLDVVDLEGDTIYYGTELGSIGNETITVDYNKNLDLFGFSCSDTTKLNCFPFPDYTFIDNVVVNSGQCDVSDSDSFESGKHNVISGINFAGQPTNLLLLDSSCTESNKEYIYQTDVLLSDFIYQSYFYDLNDGDSFTLSFEDQYFNHRIKLVFQNSNNRFLVYNADSSDGLNLEINESESLLKDSNDFGVVLSTFTNDADNFELNILFENITNNYVINDSVQSNERLKYINIDISKGIGVSNETFIPLDVFVNNSVVALYSLNGDANDLSGNNHNGVVNGAVSVPGYFSLGYDFDGVNDRIEVSDDDDFSFGDGSSDSPFSISLWFNADSLGSHGLVSKWDAFTGDAEYALLLNAGKIRINLKDQSLGGTLIREYSGALTANSWYHAVVTYDGSGLESGLKIYLNDTRVDDTSASSGSYTAMENLGESFRIGVFTSASPSEIYFDGTIDEVVVFNKTLSSAEVSDIYNNTLNQTFSSGGDIVIISQSDTSIYHGNQFTYGGILSDIEFSTAKPTQISISGTETTSFTVFVSDSVHQPDNYITLIEPINVVECSLFVDGSEYRDALSPLRSLLNKLCNSTSRFTRTLSFRAVNLDFCKVFIWIYMILVFIIALSIGGGIGYFIGVRFGYFAFSLVFSTFAIFGTYLFQISRSWIFAFALIGVSGILTLLQLFFMGGGGGGE